MKTESRLSPIRRKTAIVVSPAFLLIFAVTLFALLIGDAAGGLAGRLAGGLAFAAAAVFHALFKIARFYGDDSFHNLLISLIIILHQNYHNIACLSTPAAYRCGKKRDSAGWQSLK
jgi:hypothetical protein